MSFLDELTSKAVPGAEGGFPLTFQSSIDERVRLIAIAKKADEEIERLRAEVGRAFSDGACAMAKHLADQGHINPTQFENAIYDSNNFDHPMRDWARASWDNLHEACRMLRESNKNLLRQTNEEPPDALEPGQRLLILGAKITVRTREDWGAFYRAVNAEFGDAATIESCGIRALCYPGEGEIVAEWGNTCSNPDGPSDEANPQGEPK